MEYRHIYGLYVSSQTCTASAFVSVQAFIIVCLHKTYSPHLLEEDADDEEGVHAKHCEQVHPYVVLETSPVVSYKNGDDTDDGVKPDMMTHI